MPTLPIHPAYAANTSLAAYKVRHATNEVQFEGDASKLAKVVYDVVSSGDIPARLPIGLDSVRAMKAKAEQYLETVRSVEKWSVDVRRDDAGGNDVDVIA